MGKNVLVLGAGGFIGGHLVRRLLDDGEHVVAADIKPIQDWWQLHSDADNWGVTDASRSLFDVGPVFDEVYNLAADMGGIGFIEGHKAECMLSVQISANVLQRAYVRRFRRVFYSSSACVYPGFRQDDADVIPLRESDAYPADPEDGYGWEKLFSERLHRHFSEDYGLETRVARYHNVYGPYGSWQGGREKAPAALCRKVAFARLTGAREVQVWGDGRQTRSFCYVDDAVEGTLRVMHGDYSHPLNVGSDVLVTVDELLSVIEEVAGTSLKRTYHTTAAQGVRGRNSDNTLIERLLGWSPSTRLYDGIERTYAWIYDRVAQSLELTS